MIALAGPALLMGLFGGAHCVVMCGGVSAALCGRPEAERSAPRLSIAYNLGRVASYTALGAAVGVLGSLPLGPVLDVARFSLRALAALCMLAVGLHLLGLPSFVNALESVGTPLWRRLAPIAKRFIPLRTSWQALAAGWLWAFMPCGLLYGAVALAASSGSPAGGAATMAAFAVGTLPAMLAVGFVAAHVARATARAWVRRVAGAVVLAFGLWATAGVAGSVGVGHHDHACCPNP